MRFLFNVYFSKSENTSSAVRTTKQSISKLYWLFCLRGRVLSFILIFKTTSLRHDKRTAREAWTISSTFKRLLDQHWVGIRKDQGQTEDICKGDLFVPWDWFKRTFENQVGMNPSVPFSIFVVTKGEKKIPWQPPNYKHFASQQPERRQRQLLIKPNCLEVQRSEIQARRKVV